MSRRETPQERNQFAQALFQRTQALHEATDGRLPLHNALMVDAGSGEVLGLARQEWFYRVPAPEKENRRLRSRRPRKTDL